MGAGFGGMLVFLIIWLLPIILIAKSNRTQGGEKAAWILAIIFVSWLAWVFYLLLAPLKPKIDDL
nr:PLDc N-terminal domain-containing protein [Idiomarina aquatica]